MVQITVPKKLEEQFRPLLAKGQGSLHVFADLNAIDIKQRTYIYHHQKYLLQFQPTSKVHHLESQKDNIARYAFNLCPFDQLSSKDIPSKPLLGIFKFSIYFPYRNIICLT
jgi:replication factor A1